MTTALVVGVGAVGVHAARQLASTDGIDRVLVADADSERAEAVAKDSGAHVRALAWQGQVPEEAAVVACALPGSLDVDVAIAAVEAGTPVVSCGDSADGVRRLLDLDGSAREHGVSVVAGAGLMPGLSEVLAKYGAEVLTGAREVHVAREGTTGPGCRAQIRRAVWSRALEWRDGAWISRRPGTGRRIVYFPDPLGPQDCRRASNAAPLLITRAVPGLERASASLALSWKDAFLGRRSGGSRSRLRGAGGVHVEVRGHRGPAAEVLVFGAVDDAASATGSILAVGAAAAAGLLPDLGPAAGAGGLAEIGEASAVLNQLARRGVRAARFEGAPGA